MDSMMGMAAPMPPMSGDPMMGGMPPMQEPQSQYPSTDPSVIGQLVAMLSGLQQQDHQMLQQNQDSVLMAVLQSLGIGGAPTPDMGFAEGGESPMMPDEMSQGMGY